MELAKLVATYTADTSNWEAGHRRVNRSLQDTTKHAGQMGDKTRQAANKAADGIKSLGNQASSTNNLMARLGQGLGLYLGIATTAVTALGFRFNSMKEQALVSFKVLLKDGEAAKRLFADLQKFSDSTPFESTEVISAAKLLKAYRFEVSELLPLLTDAGNLASGMGVNFEEVARVFGRLKSGDFGEAFERLRDFGIDRKSLEGEGLVFDKSGQYKGSVEEALKGVRSIIQKNFSGMMDEQAQTFSGLTSTALDKVNSKLGEWMAPLFDQTKIALKQVTEELSKDSPDMVKAGELLGEQIGRGIGSGLKKGIPGLMRSVVEELKREAAGESVPIPLVLTSSITKGLLEGLTDQPINNLNDALKASMSLVENWAGMVTSNSRRVTNAFAEMTFEILRTLYNLPSQLTRIGAEAIAGFINGLLSKKDDAQAAISGIMGSVVSASMSALDSHSPSRKFYAIGRDVVQGFIDGIASLRASAQAYMADLLDISQMATKRTDKSGVELLTRLTSELARLNVEGREQETILELTAGIYGKLNPLIRERILLAAKEIDHVNAIKTATEAFKDVLRQLGEDDSLTPLQALNKLLADPNTTDEIKKRAAALQLTVEAYKSLLRIKAYGLEAVPDMPPIDRSELPPGLPEGIGPEPSFLVTEPPPNILTGWQRVFAGIRQAYLDMLKDLPSFEKQIRYILEDLPRSIAGVFGDAIRNMDGSFKSFFANLARGFANLLADLGAQILESLVYQFLLKIGLSFLGGIGGGSGGGGGDITSGMNVFGLASGGAIRGPGTSTSDSIPVWASDGEFMLNARAVKYWGLEILTAMNNLMMPRFAIGGGMDFGSHYVPPIVHTSSSSKTVNNSSRAVNINVTTPRGQTVDSPKSRRQLAEEIANQVGKVAR